MLPLLVVVVPSTALGGGGRGEEEGDEVLEHIFVVLSGVSLCLVAPLVLTFLAFKRKFPSYLVLSFLVCSVGLPFFSLFNAVFGVERLAKGGVACQVQAVGIQFFAAGIVWAWFFLGLNLYTIAVWQAPLGPFCVHAILSHSAHHHQHVKRVGGAKRLGRVYLALTWAFSAIQTIIPFAFGHTGPAGFWCWIDSGDNHAWELGFFYGEVGLLLCVGVLLWVRVLFAIITYSLDPMRSLHGYLLRHALLVAMFVGVMLVLFTYRVYQIFHDPPFFFKALHVVSLAGQGLITFICFGISKENYNLWKKAALAAGQRLARWRRPPPGDVPPIWRGRAGEDTVLLSSDNEPQGS